MAAGGHFACITLRDDSTRMEVGWNEVLKELGYFWIEQRAMMEEE